MLLSTKVKQLLLGSVIIAATTFGCKSGEQKTEEVVTTVTKDTTVIASSNGKMDSAIVKIDSSVLTKTITTKKMGIAKPNPAKKGGKGKIIIITNAPVVKPPIGNTQMIMDNDGYYDKVDVSPSYPGGEKALARFVEKNIIYPEDAINDGVEGTVNVVFAVDENGNVSTPTTKGETVGYGLDEAAADVIKKMPRWKPGSIKGKNVKTRFTLPITFQIN